MAVSGDKYNRFGGSLDDNLNLVGCVLIIVGSHHWYHLAILSRTISK
jgi:hypothetical protein